jgi:hypothetical protein
MQSEAVAVCWDHELVIQKDVHGQLCDGKATPTAADSGLEMLESKAYAGAAGDTRTCCLVTRTLQGTCWVRCGFNQACFSEYIGILKRMSRLLQWYNVCRSVSIDPRGP